MCRKLKTNKLWTEVKNSFVDLPKMSPKKAPALQKMMECHSSLIFMNKIENDAVTMPKMIRYKRFSW